MGRYLERPKRQGNLDNGDWLAAGELDQRSGHLAGRSDPLDPELGSGRPFGSPSTYDATRSRGTASGGGQRDKKWSSIEIEPDSVHAGSVLHGLRLFLAHKSLLR